jgi:hypothetical protein
MIRVGLVGENPNDTFSIKHILEKKYNDKIQFIILIKKKEGDTLESAKIKKTLPIEFKDEKCDFAVFIRDLDSLKSNTEQLNKRLNWFNELNARIKNNGVLLLNIRHLEALILGDIAIFNKFYNLNYKFKGDPMFHQNPKRTFKSLTFGKSKEYKEAHCPEIFKLLDFNLLLKNCSCFKDFIIDFENKFSTLAKD